MRLACLVYSNASGTLALLFCVPGSSEVGRPEDRGVICSIEELAVRSGSDEDQIFRIPLVDQEPVA